MMNHSKYTYEDHYFRDRYSYNGMRRIENVAEMFPQFQDYKLWQALAEEGMKLTCTMDEPSQILQFALLQSRGNGRYSIADEIRVTRESCEDERLMKNLVTELTRRIEHYGDPRHSSRHYNDRLDAMNMAVQAVVLIPSSKNYSID